MTTRDQIQALAARIKANPDDDAAIEQLTLTRRRRRRASTNVTMGASLRALEAMDKARPWSVSFDTSLNLGPSLSELLEDEPATPEESPHPLIQVCPGLPFGALATRHADGRIQIVPILPSGGER